MSLVRLDKVSKFYGANLVLDEIGWQIAGDDRVGLIGNNGSGKTTLFAIVSGEMPDLNR